FCAMSCILCDDILLSVCSLCLFFFFFQAEDGIRDSSVTGVQTCALPILSATVRRSPSFSSLKSICARWRSARRKCLRAWAANRRSEERRVGKECRCRRGRDE